MAFCRNTTRQEWNRSIDDRHPPKPAISRPSKSYVDADACPVKPEIYRVAERHRVKVLVVANSFINVPRDALVERVLVGSGSMPPMTGSPNAPGAAPS